MQLESGGELLVSERRAAVTLSDTNDSGWNIVSSAVLNGGQIATAGRTHIINYKVPADYDGMTPEPEALLRRLAKDEGFDPDATIGLLTAAVMETLNTATRSADNIVVDVIVTAGISNARAAGADADFLSFDDATDDAAPAPPGTINTIVLTNATLSPAALVEAHALAIEAKCAECADLGLSCAKNPAELAQGTGTDATIMASARGGRRVRYAGKHTLFAELVAQATREATRAALVACIVHLHGGLGKYRLRTLMARAAVVLSGTRPCIPPSPMAPVPRPPLAVTCVGLLVIGLSFAAPLARSSRVLLAAVAWDRWLGEPPLTIHPVVLVGNMISAVVRATPERVFTSPALGLISGFLLLTGVVWVSLAASWLVLAGADAAALSVAVGTAAAELGATSSAAARLASECVRVAAWLVEVVLVKSAIGGQLLATVAMQMARLLERKALPQARDQLSWLCSRDPSKLSSAELIGGTLESVAENLSDGFVAPVFWYAVMGPLGALGYRVVNTLDSRVGYHGKFEWFGKPSARLDDLMNLAPARLTALCLCAAALVAPECDGARGLQVAWRDCWRCESPNAGWPMAAMAGLLGVRLEKAEHYHLGDPIHPLSLRSIHVAVRVFLLAGGLVTFLGVALSGVISPL